MGYSEEICPELITTRANGSAIGLFNGIGFDKSSLCERDHRG